MDKDNNERVKNCSCERELVRRLMVSVNRIDGIWYRLARKSGIKVNTLSLFFALDDGRPRTQAEICEEWLMPKTTLNTIVRECVEEGYIKLLPSDNVKEKLVILTDKGRSYADEILALFYRVEDEAMRKTVLERGPEFIDSLELYTDNLKKEAGVNK